MNNILKDLYACMKEEKSVFNFMSDEDLKNLEVEIKKETEFEGRELLIVVGIYSKGALCILDDSLRTVTAEALEDVTLAIITQKNLDILIDINPKFGAKLLKGMLLTVSIRLRKSFDRSQCSSDLLYLNLSPI